MTLEEAKRTEESRNKENIANYYALCGELVRLCNHSALHWRHQEIAQSLVSLLLRRDIEYPHAAVLIFSESSYILIKTQQLVIAAKLLASDHMQLRKTAVGLLSSWLRINKPKAVRIEPDIDKGVNKPGAKWPIRYGIREDNEFLIARSEDEITSEQAWNETRFHKKAYVSFYIWPRSYRVYEAPSKQPHVSEMA